MARTQAADYEEKRTRIKLKTARLFARRGFHSSSINDIAEACSMSKSALYHYFSSKEQVLYELLRDHAQTLTEISERHTRRADLSPTERLHAYAAEMLETNVRFRDKHTLILGELDALPPAEKKEVAAMLRRPIEMWYDTFAELNPRLQGRADLQFPAVMMFLGMINWTHTWFSEKGPVSIETFARTVCDTFLNGFTTTEIG